MTAPMPDNIRCVFVQQDGESVRPSIQHVATERFPHGEVTIKVAYSSLNFKDALACQGHRGIVRSLPHVPGIDLAGRVVTSTSPDFSPGDEVLVTGYDLGQGHWGGWAEFASVPAEWVFKIPDSLSLFESMFIGTAGFTAAQCLVAIQRNAVTPECGPIAVTGSTGAVGSLAIRLLAQSGYEVVAVTGKPEYASSLQEIGASRVISREELMKGDAARPMLSATWAGAVDTAGGAILSHLVKTTRYGGCVAACGLVAGTDLDLTVYPFLLRGVSLCGAASADCPRATRIELWRRLSQEWKPQKQDVLVSEVNLEGLLECIPKMTAGQIAGRVVVSVH